MTYSKHYQSFCIFSQSVNTESIFPQHKPVEIVLLSPRDRRRAGFVLCLSWPALDVGGLRLQGGSSCSFDLSEEWILWVPDEWSSHCPNTHLPYITQQTAEQRQWSGSSNKQSVPYPKFPNFLSTILTQYYSSLF